LFKKSYVGNNNHEPIPGRDKISEDYMNISGHWLTALVVIISIAGCLTPAHVYYITVDGEKCVPVETREEAKEAVSRFIDQQTGANVLDVKLEEKMGIEEAVSSTSCKPVSVNRAVDMLNTKGTLTITTTEEVSDNEEIEYDEKFRSEPALCAGEIKVEEEGKNGVKEITKVLTKENGKLLSEEVVDEEIVKEPVQKVILAGINECAMEKGVSYDLSAEYEKLQLPAEHIDISSHFGPRWGRNHNGTDFALSTGSEIYAADDGEVYCSSYCGGFGNIVKIDHGNGMQTYYAHCSQLLVSPGQHVKAGELIALAGSTGNSTGPHLHFEVIINGTNMDPIDFLSL